MAARPVATISAAHSAQDLKTCPAGPATPMGLRAAASRQRAWERKCYRAAHPPWRQRRSTPPAASGARAANRSGTAAGRTPRSRRRTATSSPASGPRPGSPGNCSSSRPGTDRIRQPGGAQQPADRVRRALPPEQRADGGETHDETRPRSRRSPRFPARRSVSAAAGERGCRSGRSRPSLESAPRRTARARMRPVASRCCHRGLWLPAESGVISHLFTRDYFAGHATGRRVRAATRPKATTRSEGKPASPARLHAGWSGRAPGPRPS